MVGMSPEVGMNMMRLGIGAREAPLDQEYKRALVDQIRAAIPRHGEELNLRRQQMQQTQQHHGDTLQLQRGQLQLHRDQFREQQSMNVALKENRLEAAQEHKEKMREIVARRAALADMTQTIDIQGKQIRLGDLERVAPGSTLSILKHLYKEHPDKEGITSGDIASIRGDILKKYTIEGDKVDERGVPVFGGTIYQRLQESARNNPDAFDDLEAYDAAGKWNQAIVKGGIHRVPGAQAPGSKTNRGKLSAGAGAGEQEEESLPRKGKFSFKPGDPIQRRNPDGTTTKGYVSPDGKTAVWYNP